MFDAALDLFVGVGFAAPAVDLRPAGDAGLDAMTGEIAIHGLIVALLLGLGVDRVWPRADQRKISDQNDIEELGQFIEARLADKAPDAGDARVSLGDELRCSRVGLVDIHRAELVDLDQLVVEAVALLLEQDRSAAVEFDCDRNHGHNRRQGDERERADHFVEQPFHHHVPVGDRLVEHIEHRNVAEIGIGAGPEMQLVRMRGQADVDWKHPELLQHLQDAAFGRNRQRKDHQIDAGAAREFDEVVDRAELAQTGDRVG